MTNPPPPGPEAQYITTNAQSTGSQARRIQSIDIMFSGHGPFGPGSRRRRAALPSSVVFSLMTALLAFLSVPLRSQDTRATFSHNRVVVALKPDKDPDSMRQERQRLGAILTGKLGKPVQVIVPLSGAVILEGLANGSIDIAHVSGTDLVNARSSGAGDLLLAVEIDGKTSYRSYWLASKDSPMQGVESLRGRKVAFASRTSTSGFVIPAYDLKARGLVETGRDLETYFGSGNLWFGSGYVSAVERVLRGEADAAAVSDYVFDKDKHLSPEQKARLKVIADQGPVPTHVLVASKRLSASDLSILRKLLLSLNEPLHHDLRDAVFVSTLVEVDPVAHVEYLDAALEFAKTVR